MKEIVTFLEGWLAGLLAGWFAVASWLRLSGRLWLTLLTLTLSSHLTLLQITMGCTYSRSAPTIEPRKVNAEGAIYFSCVHCPACCLLTSICLGEPSEKSRRLASQLAGPKKGAGWIRPRSDDFVIAL